VVGRTHDLAVHQGVEHRQHLALEVGLDQIGAELVAYPQRAAGELEAFGVEVAAGQVALFVPSWTTRNGTFLSGSCRKTVSSFFMVPPLKSTL
jgi:hypothetical protein